MNKKLRSRTLNSAAPFNSKFTDLLNKSDPATAQSSSGQQRFTALVREGEYERALQFLKVSGNSNQFQHDRAVCLMRLGRFDEAVGILRRLVLNPNCVWMRGDIPLYFKTNYATALLLSGHPAGCRSLLGELNDEGNPLVIRIRKVIKEWEQSMSLWQRLNWKWCGLEPADRPVVFGGDVGEFEQFLVAQPPTSTTDSPQACFKVAV